MERDRSPFRSREETGDSSDDSEVDQNRRRRRLEPFLGGPKQPFLYPDQTSSEEKYRTENPAHRVALFILSSFTLLLSCALVGFFVIGDDDGTIYNYFAVTGARHTEFKVVSMITVFLVSGFFPAAVALWACSLYGEVLMVAYVGVGRAAILCKWKFNIRCYDEQQKLCLFIFWA